MLEDYVKAVVKRINGSDAEALAMSNVTARLYNTKPVKETITYIMASIYGAVGIQNPAVTSNQSIKPLTGSKPVENDIRAIEVAHDERHEAIESDEDKFVAEPDWDGFESKDESDRESEGYSRYDELLGSSSDDGSQLVEDSDGGIRRPSVASRRTIRSRGLSVSVSGSSQSPSPPPQGKRTSKPPPQATKPGSTFLPTLMGGYWSGSEESATDDDEAAPAPRKNRPGQQARRAIWEKKFGVRANHLKDQAKAKAKDVHWDPKRGATASDGRANGRGNGRRAGFVRSREQVTGENAIAVKPRVRVIGRKDDVGALHPSWEATKKAKAKEKTAKFEGKKVVFD